MWRGHRARLLAAGLVILLGISSLVAFAVLSEGNPVRQLDVHDSGIWVTNDLDGYFGRVNKAAGSIDTYFTTPGGAAPPFAFDIRQDRGVVVAWDRSGGRLLPVDVERGVAVGDRAVPVAQDSQLDMRGGTLAMLDPKSGKVRASRYGADAKSADMQVLESTMPALMELGAASPAATGGKTSTAASVGGSLAMAVGQDGSVYAVSSGGKLVVARPTPTGFERPEVSERTSGGTGLQVTAVGTTVVVLEGSSATVWIGDRRVSLGEPDPSARLQQPGPDADAVIVATSKGLFSVPLGAGEPRPLFAAGTGAPAAPVRLGPCVYAAWAGTPGSLARACGTDGATPQTMDREGVLKEPVFRINRDQMVLNDASTGRVFDVEVARSLDNWDQIKEAVKRDNANAKKAQETPAANKETKPKASEDKLGARPGRTTILHVLDNDSDPAGRILSIVSVSAVEQQGVKLTIAPDRQSILLSLPPQAADLVFTYTVDNGTQATAQAQVSVSVSGPADNGLPSLRTAYQPKPFAVVAGDTLSIPVTDDWRDEKDGDPVQVLDAKTNAGPVPVTPDGKIDYTPAISGGDPPGSVEISYRITDGIGEPVPGKVTVTVLAPTAPTAASAITQPDVVSGIVGVALVIRPLDNDLPGADPSDPKATLKLGGNIAPKDHITVDDTDTKTGKVTVTADKAGSYLLDYQVAFGGAALAPGQIRVDISSPPDKPEPPVTMPDFGAVRGQVPVMVDVLANDSDPAGGLLTVVDARPNQESEDRVQVDVIRGRWLRITPSQETLGKGAIVTYQVSNGSGALVPGDVTLAQLPAVSPDPAHLRDDTAVVRDGDSTLVYVLDNDSTESGAFLHLAQKSGGPNPGQLPVYDDASSGGPTVDLGRAYVSRDAVRFVAPDKVDIPRRVRIEYAAQNDSGDIQIGNLYVTINPQPTESFVNQAPQPQVVEARATSGDTIEIPVLTSGIDPDGDSVTLVGVGSGAERGRVLGTSPTSITYQAYPDSTGTDQFSYVVTDRYGALGTGLVRVSVIPAGAPPRPVAVPDTITARPGAVVVANVTANDLVSPSDPATVVDLDQTNSALPQSVSLKTPKGPIEATVQDAKADAQVIGYALANSGGKSATVPLTIRSKEGYNNPPVAVDAIAKVESGATSATVNVLERDYDIDGPESALQISKLGLAAATHAGGVVTLPVAKYPQIVPYEITDAEGAAGTAVIFVPGAGNGLPFVKAGSRIDVPQNGKVTVALSDYVVAPSGGQVQATVSDKLWSSPGARVGVAADSATTLTVSGLNDYIGPGAITLEVMDRPSLNDPTVKVTIVTIPVQVGEPTPVLRCPTTPITIYEGGSAVDLNITAMCHVWTPTVEERASLKYAASWQKPVAGVDVQGSGEAKLRVRAASSAVPGSTGELMVSVVGTKAVPAILPIQVLAVKKARFAAVNLDGIQQGTSATIGLKEYVKSDFLDPVLRVVSVDQTSGMPSAKSFSEGTLTLTPDKASFGTMTFRVVATDVADTTRTDRHVTGVVTLKVFGVPDKPGAPQIGSVVQSKAVNLSWTTPDNHGAPIDQYEVTVVETGQTQTCQASPCNIVSLKNAFWYHFTVKARNKAGWGDPSAPSGPGRADAAPTAVTNFKASNPTDHGLTLSWNAVKGEFTDPTTYKISWPGGSLPVPGAQTSTPITGLNNNVKYDFTIVAINDYSAGPPASTQGQSSGAPGTPAALSVTSVAMAGGAAAAVRIAWSAVDPNGPTPLTYTVNRTGGSGPKTICSNVTVTTCNDDGVTYDGTTYQYAVTATNATGGAAHTSTGPAATFKAIGTPLAITTLAAPEPTEVNKIKVTYTTVAARGASATVKIYEGGTLKSQQPENPAGGQPSSQTFTAAYDGNSHTYTAVVCNESARCGPASNTAAQKPYTNPTVTGFNAFNNGTSVYVSVSGNGGGRAARLQITSTNAGGWSHVADITDNYSANNIFVGNVGDSWSGSFSVTISDTSGKGRPTASAGPDVVTTPPPPPAKTVTAWKGGASPSTGCTYYLGGACPYIMASTSGFSGLSYTCSSYVKPSSGTYAGQTIFIYTTATKNGDFSGNTLSWTGYKGEVWVNCGGVDSPHVAW